MFLSSHILPEIDRVADRVGIVRESRLIAVDTLEGFKAKSVATLTIQFASQVDVRVFERLDSVRSAMTRNDGTVVRLTVEGTLDSVIKLASQYEVVSLATDKGDLDEVFLSYYEGTP